MKCDQVYYYRAPERNADESEPDVGGPECSRSPLLPDGAVP
jgi:hypothetical protein